MHQSTYHLIFECFYLFGHFISLVINTVLTIFLGHFYKTKQMQKQVILQILDPKYKYKYNMSNSAGSSSDDGDVGSSGGVMP